ncbi:MAG TPA: ABC transporter substrate-binding protein [Trueperaceae bacterium]|nr:ABC transporter substrate-binding protein [Trueperaceae bacterium]
MKAVIKFTLAVLTLLTSFALAAGNTLVIGIYQDVAQMNPIRTTSAANLRTATQIVESLFRLDGQTGEPVPHLASAWTRIDELTVDVSLKEGISFTNGEPMDAAAVKFSLETLAVEPTQVVALGAVATVDVLDDHTVRIHTKEPFPLLVLSLALNGHVVPPAYYQQVGPDGFAAHPIGTGAFKFDSRIAGQSITLVRNDAYWGGAPAVEKLEFRPIPEDTSRIAALLAGEIDIATNVPASQYDRVENAANVHVESVTGFTAKLALLDGLPDSPIADPRVRQAINYAVDKEALLDALYYGHGTLSNCQLGTPQFFGYNPDLRPYPFDPAKARALLAEAGFPNGLTVDLKYRTSSGDAELSEAIAAMLQDVGITANHIVLEGGEFLRQLSAFELRNVATLGIATAPDTTYGHNIFLQDAPYSYYRNPAFDEVVHEASRAIDPAKRLSLLNEAAAIACEDPVALFLFSLEEVYGVSDRVSGFAPSPDNLLFLEKVTLD